MLFFVAPVLIVGALDVLRVPASACVCAPTRSELAAALAGGRSAVGLAEMTADLLHRWTDAELEELQWPALAATARAMRETLSDQDERDVWARDVVSAHALDLDGSVWLVPAAAHLPRTAPTGATLTRCEQTGDLLLVHAGPRSASPAAIRRPRSGLVGTAAAASAAAGEGGEAEGRGVPGAISSGWRSNAELLLHEGRAQAVLESERVYVGAELLQSVADTSLCRSADLGALHTRVLQGLERYGYLHSETEAGQLPMGSGEHGTGVGASVGASVEASVGASMGASVGASMGAGVGARGAPDAWGGCLLAGGYCEDSLGRVLQALAISEAEIAQFTVEGCVINIGEAVSLSTEHERRAAILLRDACSSLLLSSPTTLAHDVQILEGGLVQMPEGEAVTPAGSPGGQLRPRRLLQAVRARVCRKRCLEDSRSRADAFVQRPTAMATLRRPWKAHIRTSG